MAQAQDLQTSENMEIKKGFKFWNNEKNAGEDAEKGKFIITGTGRRKTAVARLFLYTEKGDFFVNDKPIDEYFESEQAKATWMRPFHAVGISHPMSQFSGTVKIHGSGKSAQADALMLAFARALDLVNEEYSSAIRKQGLLTRDSRMVERKKPFLKKARKRPQYSKR